MSNLTQARAAKITEFLNADAKRAEKIFALGAEDALSQINGGTGQNFTMAELKEYSSAVNALSDDALTGVAGGAGSDVSEDGFLTSLAVGLTVAFVSRNW